MKQKNADAAVLVERIKRGERYNQERGMLMPGACRERAKYGKVLGLARSQERML